MFIVNALCSKPVASPTHTSETKLTILFTNSVQGGGCYYDASKATAGQVFLNEWFGSLAYLFISYGVSIDPSQARLFGPRLSPLLAGGCLGLVTFATSNILPGYAGAQANPARCFGFGIARKDMSDQWIWWFAPAVAALMVAGLFNLAPLRGEEGAEARGRVRPRSGGLAGAC